jgi:signal transduction histidine kinase
LLDPGGVLASSLLMTIALAAVLALFAVRLRARARRAEEGERLAVERRDRFLGEAAGALTAPLDELRAELSSLSPLEASEERLASLSHAAARLHTLVDELARLPRASVVTREEVDVAELVREALSEPPFAEHGPSVILRAEPVRMLADRGRLESGLRVLLWVLRREASGLVVTVAPDEGLARVELETQGARAAVDALERLPAVLYGLRGDTAPPGATLALRVASEVARAHGGRLRASARPGHGERFVLELPTRALHL